MDEKIREEDMGFQVIVKPDRELFYSMDTNYGIYAVELAKHTDDSNKIKLNDYGNFVIRGSTPVLEHGKQYKAKVRPKEDKKYGLGYDIISIYEEMPTTKDDQITFLKAVLTDKQVEEIFKAYPNEDVIELISEDKFDYSIVKGIGEATYDKVKKKVSLNLEYREAIVKLSETFGVTHNMIKKMSDHYGSPTLLVQKIEENPYILSYEVDGIGFKKCDTIALNRGVEKDSPLRIGACILFILDREANQGHTWVSKNKLNAEVANELGLRMKKIGDFVEDTPIEDIRRKIYVDEERVSLQKNYRAEKDIARHIKRLLNIENNYHIGNIDGLIYEAEQEQGFDFTDEQKEAIHLAVEKNVMIITGFGGTGKTSVLKGILKVLGAQDGLFYATCALSGKASQRIQETTGVQSHTIHRLLGYNPSGGFKYNEDNPMDYDVIVLDESSMVNSNIMSKLVSATKDGAKLIFLGDVGQLEAIGVGNCFSDLISSDLVPKVELTKVHRQAQKSGILSIANQVREGVQFTKRGDYKKKRLGELEDLWFYPYKDADKVYNSVVELANKFNGGNILDFQVVVPMKSRGRLSTKNLNEELQNIFNPDEIGKPSIKRGKSVFRQGDKIIQNGNNYDYGVFNGTIGIVEFVDSIKKIMVIDFEGVGRVEYKQDDLNQIDLAYALTIHRCQGSEFRYVVMAFDYSSYVLLSRQLLYTGLTRASDTCFLMVELNALQHAVRTDKSTLRQTFLVEMLK